jgi:hypothetical protein
VRGCWCWWKKGHKNLACIYQQKINYMLFFVLCGLFCHHMLWKVILGLWIVNIQLFILFSCLKAKRVS